MPLREAAPASNIKEAILEDLLHRKARTGELIRVTPRLYPRATLAHFAAVTQVITQTVPGGQFTAARFRNASGVGRGLAIEILECLDRLRITQRIGDVREMREDFVPILGPATRAARATAGQKLNPRSKAVPRGAIPPHQYKR